METTYEEIWQTEVALIRVHLITERLRRRRLEEDLIRTIFNEAAAIRHHLVRQQNDQDRRRRLEEDLIRTIFNEAATIRDHLVRQQNDQDRIRLEEDHRRTTTIHEAGIIRQHLRRNQQARNTEHEAQRVNEASSAQLQLPWEANGHARKV
ncbi:hypothetical protein ABFA07_002026 [Porites harrisoni]